METPERGKRAGLNGVRSRDQLATGLPVHSPGAANAGLSGADIKSIACCSMREGIVLYDQYGDAIWACANVDARASREVAELKEIHNDRLNPKSMTSPGRRWP
jgi:hypothetical protein